MFVRNAGLTITLVGMLTIVLVLFLGLIVFNYLANTVINLAEDQINISVYFYSDIPEEDILRAKEEIASLEGVNEVRYISKEEALIFFQERRKDDPATLQILEEVGGNPLEASLVVKTKDTSYFSQIENYINSSFFKDKIRNQIFKDNKRVIERLYKITWFARIGGALITIIFGFLVFVIALNTIRLGIYSFREEIGIMKLVGASNWFVRGPFIVYGIICSMVAAIISIVIFYFVLIVINQPLVNFVNNIRFGPLDFFGGYFFWIVVSVLIVGIGIVYFSTFVAIRKYLEV